MSYRRRPRRPVPWLAGQSIRSAISTDRTRASQTHRGWWGSTCAVAEWAGLTPSLILANFISAPRNRASASRSLLFTATHDREAESMADGPKIAAAILAAEENRLYWTINPPAP